ncbi:MAG: hypothetical protein IH988_08830 [Planctomycetes bacterium]|nr:hypothetical protein [Planctomycetota bacterium]
MSQTKKITYGAILGVAGLAVGVDQLFLGEATAPAQAQAGAGESRGAGIALSTAVEQATPGLSVTATPFPANLPALDESYPVRDLFSLTDEVRALLLGSMGDDTGSESSDGGSSTQRNEYRTVEGFTQRHQLEAVIVAGSRVGAVVDGAWIQVGQSIDECPLLRVEGRTAVFQCIDGEARIAVGGDGPLSPAPR